MPLVFRTSPRFIAGFHIECLLKFLAVDCRFILGLFSAQKDDSHLRQMLAVVFYKGLQVFLLANQFKALRKACCSIPCSFA
jgi:hypothetical protein